MHDRDSLIELLKKNEEISSKFHAIERKILSILNFTDLFEVLLTEIREKFQVPYVWLTLIAAGEVPDLLGFLDPSDLIEANLSILPEEEFSRLVPTSTRPLLVNQNIKAYARMLPPRRKYLIKSAAIAPLMLDGHIIGSLNQADFCEKRFAPGMDTSCLEQLALKASLCLANVTAHEKLKFLAYHDPLTGLLNRRVMTSILKREVHRAKRYRCPLSVVFLDVDDFKRINDVHGHDAGDRLLVHLADHLQAMVRETDVVARFAGDEFVVILPETTMDSAVMLMERIRAFFFDTPAQIGTGAIPLSISFGVADNASGEHSSPDDLLKAADKALYKMKAARKNHAVSRKAP